MVAAFKAAVVALSPRDQVVLSNLLANFDIVGRAVRRTYPALDAEAVQSQERTAAVLGVPRRELAEDRLRMEAWLDDTSRRLQHGPLPARGGE